MLRSHLLILTLMVFTGCDMGFERQSQIARVRVLAVKSTPPELTVPETPGGLPRLSVQLEALVVKPDGSTPPIRYALCRFGNPYAADFECPGKDGLDLPDGKLSLTQSAVQAFTGLPLEAGPPGTPVGALLPSRLSFFVGFEANDGSGTPEGVERGVRQLDLRRTDVPNQNPELLDLEVDGASFTGPLSTGETVSIKPVLSGTSRELYLGPEGEAVEPMAYSWHGTGSGFIRYFRSLAPAGEEADNSSTEYTAPAAPETVTFYVVARDGRGGTAWLTRSVQVE